MIPGYRSSLNIWCVLISITVAGCLADATIDQDDVVADTELSKVSQAGTSTPTKPAPLTPQLPSRTMKLPDKPARNASAWASASASAEAAAAAAWTVSLVASQPSPWVGTNTTLTATTNIDVWPTPYFIRIWDDDNGADIAACAAGTTCTATVTRPARATSFKAMIAPLNGPPLAWAFASVYWHVSGVRLTESETTVAVGNPVQLTTFTDYDIASSPYYVQIHDVTTGTILRACGGGTTCSVTVSQGTEGTHRYRACFSGFSATYPPPSILECTPDKFVAWSGSPTTVFLQPSSPDTITAISAFDVSTTPYYIQIYRSDGSRIAACGLGASCNVASTASCNEHLSAFVGLPTLTLPNIAFRMMSVSRVLSMRDWTQQGSPVGPCPGPPGPPRS